MSNKHRHAQQKKPVDRRKLNADAKSSYFSLGIFFVVIFLLFLALYFGPRLFAPKTAVPGGEKSASESLSSEAAATSAALSSAVEVSESAREQTEVASGTSLSASETRDAESSASSEPAVGEHKSETSHEQASSEQSEEEKKIEKIYNARLEKIEKIDEKKMTELIDSRKEEKCLIYIGRPNCPDCYKFSEILQTVAQERDNKHIYAFDCRHLTDEGRNYLKKLGIEYVPSLIQVSKEEIVVYQAPQKLEAFRAKVNDFFDGTGSSGASSGESLRETGTSEKR